MDGMFAYLNWNIDKDDFPCERFINAFIYYQEDKTDIGTFIRLFDNIVFQLAKRRVKSENKIITPDSSLGLFMANYQAYMDEFHLAE